MEAYALGFGEPVGLSAQHGEGMAELYQAIREALGEEAFEAALAEEEDEGAEGFGAEVLDQLAEIDIDNPDLTEEALNAALAAAGIDDAAEEQAAAEAKEKAATKPIRLAIVGRPNAGKSTLINQLLQSDRLLTGPEAGHHPGTSVTIKWTWEGREIRLVDTAGLRKRAKVQERLEKMSTGETVRSLKYADIVALIMGPG